MAKIIPQSLPPKEQKALARELERTLAKLQESNDLIVFLEHALSESERVMLARRIRIAKQLMQGKTHRTIADELKVGLPTVQAVDRWLSEWRNYRKEMPLLLKEALQRKRSGHREPYDPYSFRSLRRRYPLHYLFFNLILDGEA